MRGVNKTILIGISGNDAEVRFMPSGAAVANVSLATNEEWLDKQTNEKKSRTEWHRVTFMDRGNFRLGQVAGDFIKKGSKVYVEGSLRTREWEKDGIKRYTTEIIANEMQLLDSRQDGQGGQQQGGQPQQGGYNQQPAQRQQGQQPAQQRPQAQPQSYGSFNGQQNGYQQAQNNPQGANPSQQQAPNFDDFDDGIPF